MSRLNTKMELLSMLKTNMTPNIGSVAHQMCCNVEQEYNAIFLFVPKKET